MGRLENYELGELFEASVFQKMIEGCTKQIAMEDLNKVLQSLGMDWEDVVKYLSIDKESGLYSLKTYPDHVSLSKNVLEWKKTRIGYSLEMDALVALIEQGKSGIATSFSYINQDIDRTKNITHLIVIGVAETVLGGVALRSNSVYRTRLNEEIEAQLRKDKLDLEEALS